MKRNQLHSASGFTLIELLVYMAILGFIIVVAGRAYSDSVNMRVRTQNMTKSTAELNAVVSAFQEDMLRMGAKEWKEDGNRNFDVDPRVYMQYTTSPVTPNPNGLDDSSSYNLARNKGSNLAVAPAHAFDSVTFRTIDYTTDGTMQGVREISWAVRRAQTADTMGTLTRYCTTLAGDASAECPNSSASGVAMTQNVKKFSLTPSIPGIEGNSASPEMLFPSSSSGANAKDFSFVQCKTSCPTGMEQLSLPGAGSSLVLSDIYKNSTLDGTVPSASSYNQVFVATPADVGKDWTDCQAFSFERGVTYAIDFDMPYYMPPSSSSGICSSCMFQPGVDHMAIGLRLKSDPSKRVDSVPDFLFYPPQVKTDASILRHQEFSIPIKAGQPAVSACVAFTFAFYSQSVRGPFKFENLKIYRKTNEAYHFLKETDTDYYTYNPPAPPALAPTAPDRIKSNVKAFELQMEVDSKGEVSRSKTVIPVPNNGTEATPRK
jgi:type II secretory pathway pseudopilin PulG